MDILSKLTEIIVMAPPVLLALTFHEFSHGYIAYRLGDSTAQRAGRLTLNPLHHLDPLGTIAFFVISFGWAKPVPVNPYNFRNPKKDMLWVALAGPASNIILAVISALLLKAGLLLATLLPNSSFTAAVLIPLLYMLRTSVWINLVLCIFNFLPIPPLDGGRILTSLLPDDLARAYQQVERYGFIIILLLSFSGILGRLISPIIYMANHLLLA